MNYNVQFEFNGQRKTESFEGHDVGNAFRKCLKKYSGCHLILASCQRRWPGGNMIWMDYQPPSQACPEPLPKEKMQQVDLITDDPRRPKPKREKAAKAGKINA